MPGICCSIGQGVPLVLVGLAANATAQHVRYKVSLHIPFLTTARLAMSRDVVLLREVTCVALQDRIHRLGQFKPITVTRFVIAGTIEERILKLQDKKQLVFEGTVGRDSQVLFYW